MPRTLKEARQAYKEATDLLPTLTCDAEAFEAKEREIAAIEAEIGQLEREARAVDIRNRSLLPADGVADPSREEDELDNALSRFTGQSFSPNGGGVASVQRAMRFNQIVRAARAERGVRQLDPQKHFRSFGEFLQAVFVAATSHDRTIDSRLVRVGPDISRAGPTGASEVDPTGGGFLVQFDFGTGIWMLAHEMGDILGAVNKIPISAKSNGLKIMGVDETSRATGSRWGGVQSYWAGEGVNPGTSKPKFRMIEFDLKKLMSLMYTTEELVQDAEALGAIAAQAFAEEIMFMTEDAIVEGSGAGLPLGVLNSTALVSVAKQPGQAAGTVLKENVDNMWARMWARSRKNAVWYINQDCEPQLNQMGQVVGTGGLPVYLPPGGLSSTPYGTLYGRPVIATEYNPALGTPGDILLADLSQYTIVDKGAVNTATSMHVAFLTDEWVFRITYRVDGRPMWTQALTPFKGTLTKSPFVAIAQR